MRFPKKLIVAIVVLVLIGISVFVFVIKNQTPAPAPVVEKKVNLGPTQTLVGTSVEGRTINAYTYQNLPGAPASENEKKHLLFVGGIHGGYEWNSVLLAYNFMDYLQANPSVIPDNLKVTVIPNANPDGVYKVLGTVGRFTLANIPADESPTAPGRFNANGVDLNRNFDCNWQPESTWQNKTVSAGTAPFSEPEASAIRDFVLKEKPTAVIFWHSQSNAVYASECNDGILPQTLDIMNAYSGASGYTAVKSFDSYAITGDSEGWLASIGIPAITVELSTHETTDWDKNLAGVKALFEYYK